MHPRHMFPRLRRAFSSTSDKLLFTPGPLGTSKTVRQAMMRDLGSREPEFIRTVQTIRTDLVRVAGVPLSEYDTVLMQGSGTFSVESVVSSYVPPDGKLLVLANGAYGRRIKQMADCLKIQTVVHEYEETEIPNVKKLERALQEDGAITNVAAVHSETTSGVVNPVEGPPHPWHSVQPGQLSSGPSLCTFPSGCACLQRSARSFTGIRARPAARAATSSTR